jgi:hypothetical protein
VVENKEYRVDEFSVIYFAGDDSYADIGLIAFTNNLNITPAKPIIVGLVTAKLSRTAKLLC